MGTAIDELSETKTRYFYKVRRAVCVRGVVLCVCVVECGVWCACACELVSLAPKPDAQLGLLVDLSL